MHTTFIIVTLSSMKKMKLAAVQTSSTATIAENIARISPMIRKAQSQGANLVALPENAFLMASGRAFHTQVYTESEHPALLAMQILAKELKIWILIGSLAVKTATDGKQTDHEHLNAKYANRQLLISPEGETTARYDKIYLFDVSITEGESHKESARFIYGQQAVTAQVDAAMLGLTICYDVRFPQLHRALAKAGADILTIPAAFTRYTGEKGGWHVLCRARAMETGCFVIAPAQCGTHGANRQTYGHSLIIDPWGTILAEADDEPTIIYAEIDLEQVTKTRQAMPSLTHDREFTL